MNDPLVSVIIPACDVMPWLTECVESVLAQSIGEDAVEVIAVNDAGVGSDTDRVAALDRYATADPRVQVVHLPENAGGRGQLCNVGLAAAGGEYVLFLEGNDYLHPRALERMYRMAREAGSDLVIGRSTAVPGFVAGNKWTLRRNQRDAGRLDPGAYDGLGRNTLFRQELLRDNDIVFPLGRVPAPDQWFATNAFLHAKVVSVVADHECYFRRDYGDAKPQDPVEFIAYINSIAELLASHVPAGERRDHLLERHVRREVLTWALGRCWFDDLPAATRQSLLIEAGVFINRWGTPALAAKLPPMYRVMAYCLQNGKHDELADLLRHHNFGTPRRAIVDDGSVYAGLPLFRSPSAAIPDDCYSLGSELRLRYQVTALAWYGSRIDVSGHAFIPHIDTVDQTVTVVVRERDTHVEYRVEAQSMPSPELPQDLPEGDYDYRRAGFAAHIDLERIDDGDVIDDGRWELFIEVKSQDVTLRSRLGAERAKNVTTVRGHRLVALPKRAKVVAECSDADGNLAFDVAADGESAGGLVRLTRCESTRTAMSMTAHASLAAWPSGASTSLCLVRGNATKTVTAVMDRQDDGFTIAAVLPSPRLALAPGWWAMGLRVTWPGGQWEVPVHDTSGMQVWLRGRPSMREVLGRAKPNVRA